MWFELLTGFREKSIEQVQRNLSVTGQTLTSHVNGKKYLCGELEVASLGELRRRVQSAELPAGKLTVREVVADVQQLHACKSNAGALFQVASQFNLLEMTSPQVTPEQGVGIYQYDPTQGPACAVAAGAGTIYRNYFVNVDGQTGQSSERQINCLADLGEALGNADHHLWKMKNGYVIASEKGLLEIAGKLKKTNESEKDNFRKLLQIGIQWNTEVTISDSKHTVTQAYCSALPVAYSEHSAELWSAFAQLVLEATYEATLCAGVLNFLSSGNNTIYLTLVGGGVFGNKTKWIIDALYRALELYNQVDLDVAIVSYGTSNESIRAIIRDYSNQESR